VTVDGAPALKSSTQVHAGQAIVIASPARTYVSRGGDKLVHGLDRFGVDPTGRRCLDAGVSTGGFTDCLLQRGAAHVWAYDVGYGQVHERIRQDQRVSVHERTNVRDLTPGDLPSPRPDLLVADLSFISLAGLLPTLRALVADDAVAVVLVKPQFEAERADVGKGGVVRDPAVWARCLRRVADAAASVGWSVFDATASPLLGPAGNVEFLAYLAPATSRPEPTQPAHDPRTTTGTATGTATDEATDAAIAVAIAEGEDRRRGA
jgi:23S rRNA (cytidine1920-2'-O)/16S rRNA (cytidine1409-2'-O)-methyltransferase